PGSKSRAVNARPQHQCPGAKGVPWWFTVARASLKAERPSCSSAWRTLRGARLRVSCTGTAGKAGLHHTCRSRTDARNRTLDGGRTRLVHERAWSFQKYQEWLADTPLHSLLIPG